MHLIVWARPSSQTPLKVRCSWQKGNSFSEWRQKRIAKVCKNLQWPLLEQVARKDSSVNFPENVSLYMDLSLCWLPLTSQANVALLLGLFSKLSDSVTFTLWLQLCLLGRYANFIFHKHYTTLRFYILWAVGTKCLLTFNQRYLTFLFVVAIL